MDLIYSPVWFTTDPNVEINRDLIIVTFVAETNKTMMRYRTSPKQAYNTLALNPNAEQFEPEYRATTQNTKPEIKAQEGKNSNMSVVLSKDKLNMHKFQSPPTRKKFTKNKLRAKKVVLDQNPYFILTDPDDTTVKSRVPQDMTYKIEMNTVQVRTYNDHDDDDDDNDDDDDYDDVELITIIEAPSCGMTNVIYKETAGVS